MDIFMRGVALAATEDDVKVELARILHKAPFPLQPVLNFDVSLFKKYNSRGKIGILTLPTESAGRTFLSSYGATGVPIKGARAFFSLSNKPLSEERLAMLNSRPWRDPRKLQEERERRIHASRPHKLKSYAFGRFLADGSFSSELVADGSADIACDLERKRVRFTLCKQGHRSNLDDDIATSMFGLTLQSSITIVSYIPKMIDSMMESIAAEEPILFIKANTFPNFSTEMTIPSVDRIDARRSQGLIPDIPMPPGCFSLACTFTDSGEKEAFKHAARSRFHVHCISKQAAIRVRENTSTHHDPRPRLDFLKDLPFQLAFEVEKATANWTLSPVDAQSLMAQLGRLRDDHGDAAAPIFRRFITLLEDERANKQPRRKSRSRRKRNAPSTLEEHLTQAVDLYLEEQLLPRGRLAPALPSSAVSYTYHMVLTPTRHIFEGPVVDQSNSVLRRFGHHECFLRVSFQDENRSKLRQDLETSINDLLANRYRPVLLNGCSVAGRLYHLLGYSMSGLKEHSLWFVTPFHDEQGRLLNATKIRESLGDFSRSLLLYQPARLGARWSQAFSATDPSINLAPDEILRIDDIKSPAGKVMTDGCSPISTELASAIWRANQRTKKRPARGNPPSAYQFRLGGAKGMVVQDPTLEGRVVCLRPSQVQVRVRQPHVRHPVDVSPTQGHVPEPPSDCAPGIPASEQRAHRRTAGSFD
ncbi:RNA dependent RNA polymerase-domain-containing protein [Butyriboletus roseoflavus]|nr:RNA dependent RNA polymerase-domain-containing protein [Butyriboletus roseoflavus]